MEAKYHQFLLCFFIILQGVATLVPAALAYPLESETLSGKSFVQRVITLNRLKD